MLCLCGEHLIESVLLALNLLSEPVRDHPEGLVDEVNCEAEAILRLQRCAFLEGPELVLRYEIVGTCLLLEDFNESVHIE